MVDALILLSGDGGFAKDVFEWVVANAGYLMVFLLMAVESSFIPFPSEVVVPPVAYLSYSNPDLNIYCVVLVATAGAIVGALVNYYLSLWIGRPVVYRFANSRFGHACLIDQAKVEKAEAYFDKHGSMSTFIGRLIPAVRQLISIPAGLARMNIIKFIIFTGLGALIWNSILGALGYWLATQFPLDELFSKVEQYNAYLTWGGIALGAVVVAYIAYNALKPNKQN